MGVIMGMPANLISLGEEAVEEAFDWVSWSSSESDCIAVSYIPPLGLLRWLGPGMVMLIVGGIGCELTVSM